MSSQYGGPAPYWISSWSLAFSPRSANSPSWASGMSVSTICWPASVIERNLVSTFAGSSCASIADCTQR